MAKSRLPNSIRKYLRQEKARLRREILDIEKREKLIEDLYAKFIKKIKEEKANKK